MRDALEWLEAFAIVFVLGVVVLLGAATFIHAVLDAPESSIGLGGAQ